MVTKFVEEPNFPKTKNLQIHEVDEVMHALWVSFHIYLGLECEKNPAPKVGYRFENDEVVRDRYLGHAIRARNKFAALSTRFKRGSDLLEQMTKDLSNAHKSACWWHSDLSMK